MRKICFAIVSSISVMTLAGPSLAQGSGSGLTGAAGENVAAHASSLKATPADIKLNASTSDLSGVTGASSSAGALSALGGSPGSDNVAKVQLGSKGASAPADADLFRNALSSNSMANALQAGGSTTESGPNATAALGVGSGTDLSNAIGGQKSMAEQRLGN